MPPKPLFAYRKTGSKPLSIDLESEAQIGKTLAAPGIIKDLCFDVHYTRSSSTTDTFIQQVLLF